jgi:hypothetical protein
VNIHHAVQRKANWQCKKFRAVLNHNKTKENVSASKKTFKRMFKNLSHRPVKYASISAIAKQFTQKSVFILQHVMAAP